MNEAKFYFQCYEHIYNNGDDAMLRADISVGALFLVALLIELTRIDQTLCDPVA